MADNKRQEANSALLVIDKGLKSHQLGEQCEAIVRFPSLMDKFPFPVMIDVAFLKLADTFRTENNLLRLNIIKVIELSQKHLHKINSKDEFFKRFYSVIHSNDPMARALTLRLFACISTIIADKKAVHHSVWRGLESNYTVEVEAAIKATDSLCQHSSDFAVGVYDKVAAIVKGIRVPPEMKLKVITVMKRMNHTLAIAKQVRDVCIQLLSTHSSTPFIVTILTTLTELSLSVIVQIPEQILLLLDFAAQDPRRSIRMLSLNKLYQVTMAHPHYWDSNNIERLIQIISDSKYDVEKEKGSMTLYVLSHTQISIPESIRSLCYNHSPVVSSYAIATCINTYISDERVNNEFIEQIIQLLLIVGNRNTKVIKVLMGSLMKLSINNKIEVEVLKLLITKLSTGDCNTLLCKTISSMNIDDKSIIIHYIIELINDASDDNMIFWCSLLLLDLNKGNYTDSSYQYFNSQIKDKILHNVWRINENKYWKCYKIAQKASKIGLHNLAESIYDKLSHEVNNMKYKTWLQCLHQYSQAQSLIEDSIDKNNLLIEKLNLSSSLLYDTSLLIKSTGQSGPLHVNFIPINASLIDIYCQLLSLCNSNILSTFTSIIRTIKDVVLQLQSVAKKLSVLIASLFDADPQTLQYITAVQQSCTLMMNVISSLLTTSSVATPLLSPVHSVSTPLLSSSIHSLEETSSDFNTQFLIGSTCNDVLLKAQSAAVRLRDMPVSYEHLSVIKDCTLSLLSVPFLLPPSFFVSYQTTNIQLVITPSSDTNSTINIPIEEQFSVKVEGVIQHDGQRIYRSPVNVLIKVVPQIKKLIDGTLKHPKLQELEKISHIKNDYFVGEFLIKFPHSGQYDVSIEINLIDNEGQTWKTGPELEVNILTDTADNLNKVTGGTGNSEKALKTPKW